MTALSTVRDRWHQQVERSALVGFVDALLRGAGQVMFQNNPLTGLLFLTGILYHSRMLAAAGALGLIVSTATALLLDVDRGLIRDGLFGFNGILVGIGLAFFLAPGLYLPVYILVSAAVSTVVMAALSRLLEPWGLPALTAPFVIATWLFLFAVYEFQLVQPGPLIAPLALDPQTASSTTLRPLVDSSVGAGLTVPNLAHALLRGVGQVMFQDSAVTGVFFLVGILVNSRIAGGMAALGSAVAAATALSLGADGWDVYHGLYGFNAVLSAIAVGGTFLVADLASVLYAAFAAVAGAVTMAFTTVLLGPLGMPALTAPFVLATWLFLLPAPSLGVLRSVSLAEVSTPEQARREALGLPDPGTPGPARFSR